MASKKSNEQKTKEINAANRAGVRDVVVNNNVANTPTNSAQENRWRQNVQEVGTEQAQKAFALKAKARRDLATAEGYDQFGLRKGSCESAIHAELTNVPTSQRDLTNRACRNNPELAAANPGMDGTHYDILNHSHDLGLIGKTPSRPFGYFTLTLLHGPNTPNECRRPGDPSDNVKYIPCDETPHIPNVESSVPRYGKLDNDLPQIPKKAKAKAKA
jgi:hypothetical protein